MRIWVDLTNSPHVLVLRPVIDVLRARGAEVRVTVRDFAQTVQLCERFGIEHEVIGRHRGGRVAAKAVGLAQRSASLVRWGRRYGPFDLALGHGSNDVTVAARVLRIPCSTMFDYEWATVQHNVNCRLAQAVVVPDAIPPERLERYGARGKLQRYPGLKEEYYLADFEPDPAVLDELKQRSQQTYVQPLWIATVQVAMGQKDQALDSLQTAFDDRSAGLVFLKVDPVFDPLRSDNRFQALLRRIGL
jgi:predicted glycosyltransferase